MAINVGVGSSIAFVVEFYCRWDNGFHYRFEIWGFSVVSRPVASCSVLSWFELGLCIGLWFSWTAFVGPWPWCSWLWFTWLWFVWLGFCSLVQNCKRLVLSLSLLLCYSFSEGMLESKQIVGYARLLVVGRGKVFFQVLCSVISMDHGHPGRCPLCETTNIHRALRRQEDYITDNRNSIFSITGRMHSQGRSQKF
jgi:hypothetical protein